MSGVSMSVGDATGAKIHYHHEIFNSKNTTVMSVAGFVGITALAVGILALLHANGIVNVGPLGSIPSNGVYALIGGGGGLVLVDVIALVVFTTRHVRSKNLMNAYMKDQMEEKNLSWWTECFSNELRPIETNPHRYGPIGNNSSVEGTIFYLALTVSGEEKSAHIFLKEGSRARFIRNLSNNGFNYVRLRN